MTLAPDTSVPPRRAPATDRPQLATHVTLGVTDPDAIATFLRPGLPCDDAFWRRVHHRCDHCLKAGTTASGGLWRVSLAGACTDLYYLHSARCLSAYRRVHGLRSVEGRLPLADEAPATSAGVWRTWGVAHPDGVTVATLYRPDGRAVATAAGKDGDTYLKRIAARLNAGGAAATTGAVAR